MTRTRRLLLLFSAAILAGCGETAPEAVKLRVAAASDLQTALPILVAAFRTGRDIEVDVTFGASGQLAEQIRQGAPFDVLLSANRGYVEKLATEKVVKPDSVRPYARGVLILVRNNIENVKVNSLEDLKKPEVRRIAIANPETAPYGMAARQALESAGLWDVLAPKIVRSESVRQALQFVQSGNAEVGFVGRGIADVPGVKPVGLVIEGYDPIDQCLGIVSKTDRADDASAFVAFVLGTDGQGILRDVGTSQPEKVEVKLKPADAPR